MYSGFSFSRVVIIQSLGADGDIPTGRLIAEYIEPVIKENEIDIPVEVIDCESPEEFIETLKELTAKAILGDCPLVHVDCHGDFEAGLSFSNGSDLEWKAVASALTSLNIATKFNLLAIFSACFGFYFTETMGITKPAPCWCLVAPCSAIKQDEILNNLRKFYEQLFCTKDIGLSIQNLVNTDLQHGAWICSLTEELFDRLTEDYLVKHCSKESGKLRLDEFMEEMKNKVTRKEMKVNFREQNRIRLFEYFDLYFSTRLVPENKSRFKKVRHRLATRIKTLKATKKYYL